VLNGREARVAWDVKGGNLDSPTIGTAADRIEIDRLLRRIEKLAAEKSDLEAQLDAKNREIDEVNARIEELQRN
jgi:predicted RNase H-like nuclease (RuvC/YqgF family)